MRFINLPAERLDGEILNAQRKLCEELGIDRSSLWIRTENDPNDAVLTHLHGTLGMPPRPARPSLRELFPWSFQKVLENAEALVIPRLSVLPPEAARDIETLAYYGTRASLMFPLAVGRQPPFGLLSFASFEERDWPEPLVKRLQIVSHVFASAIARKEAEIKLLKSLEEARHLRAQLYEENVYLREQVKHEAGHETIVGQSSAILRTLSLVKRVAGVDSAVLILGETGSGKELVAQAIHDISHRAHRHMLKVNCAALSPTLIESELFGREKGAYTGAMTMQKGRFELADGSTLFLDEVSELPLDLQAKLLRVLQEGEFERLGGSKTLKVDVRIIAATNRNILELVNQGRFRQDLYFRLNVFPIEVPPLRERPEDIPLLAWFFVSYFSKKMAKAVESIPKANLEQLKRYSWPGNVRELRNLVERAIILTEGPVLRIALPPAGADAASTEITESLEDMEAQYVRKVLDRTGWRVSGQNGAAALLGIPRTTLLSKMKKLGITPPPK